MIPTSVYILLSIEFLLLIYLNWVCILEYHRRRQWEKMWLKALNPKRVYPQLIHQEINPLPPYEVNIENRLMLLGLDDMTVRLEKLDAIRKRVEKNKVPVQNSNSFAE